MIVVVYLTYLEFVVIRAVCAWCVVYAVTIVSGWLVAVREVRRAPA